MEQILAEAFVRQLHRRMYGDVWACFPNGNGRHSRLMADIIIGKIFKQNVFSWGAADLVQQGDVRTAYLKAIKIADKGNLAPLIAFARS